MSTPLPDTSLWLPREPRNRTSIGEGLSARCLAIESSIRSANHAERNSSIDTFDSGLATEDIIRDSIQSILPSRYHVTSGTVVDASGLTAGDMDIVIFNSHWFPEIHAAATAKTRKKLLPFEGVYAVGEVKQTLTQKSLDAAMHKLVTCHRLTRAPSSGGRISENRELTSNGRGIYNPLYSFLIAVETDEDFKSLINRFFDINRSLKRRDVVRAMCVLGQGTVVWAYREKDQSKSALFMSDDLSLPIFPAYFEARSGTPALYSLSENLLLHLYHSILAPEDVVSRYGPNFRGVKVPKDSSITLLPDEK